MTRIASFLDITCSGRRVAAASMLALLLVAGCAGVPPGGTPARQALPARTFHDTIDLGGRLSIRYQQNGKDESLHGSFVWTQTGGHTLVTLLSPLGQTIATIDVTPAASTLVQAGQAPRMAADVDALVTSAIGWPLPIAGLRQWLQGFAIDVNGRRIVATPQSADTITTSDGWRIRYAGWQDGDASSAQDRPKRIDLERFTAQAGDVSIRIVIDRWQTN